MNDRVEPLVRTALGTVVKRSPEKLEAALLAFDDPSDLQTALELAASIAVHVLADSYEGKPTEEQIRDVAAAVADMGSWMDLDAGPVEAYLRAVYAYGAPLDEALPHELGLLLSFVVPGILLASSTNIREGEWWFDYLDRIEASIETGLSPRKFGEGALRLAPRANRGSVPDSQD